MDSGTSGKAVFETMRDVISTPDAPVSQLYSQAVKAGDFIYVSGLVGIDVDTGALAGPTIEQQTRQALAWFENAPPARYVAKLGVELPGVLVSIRMMACVR